MNKRHGFYSVFLPLFCTLLLFSGCTGTAGYTPPEPPAVPRATRTEFPVPEASGTAVFEAGGVSVDVSNTADGYCMVRYTGSAPRARLQLTAPDNTVYSYALAAGQYEAFPFSAGSGSYRIDVLEQVEGNMYAIVLSESAQVTLRDEFKPFLYPNQYVWFTPEDEALQLGISLSEASANDLDYVGNVYRYVIGNITYDEALAANISTDYLPEIDRTLETKKGICFDYASLMAALLRSQGIPTKLVCGYSGTAYHAWISVYLEETGWVDNIIEFDGKSWSLMDPTLAANNTGSAVKEYIGDGSRYIVKFSY